MPEHAIVSADDWLAARRDLLAKEKQFTRLREELTRARRELPWEKVEKTYTFDGPDGKITLADLFDGCSQLIVYHFMFGPDWPEGCKVCSMMGDHYDPLVVHLRHRDAALATVSRAPLATLQAYKQRMGWRFTWVSSLDSDFNEDYQVLLKQEDIDAVRAYYNYQEGVKFPVTEAPGISVFAKGDGGEVYHTYSSYGRGLENFLGVYQFLDIVPKGRDEDGLPYPMAWVRHKDRYGDETFVDPYV